MKTYWEPGKELVLLPTTKEKAFSAVVTKIETCENPIYDRHPSDFWHVTLEGKGRIWEALTSREAKAAVFSSRDTRTGGLLFAKHVSPEIECAIVQEGELIEIDGTFLRILRINKQINGRPFVLMKALDLDGNVWEGVQIWDEKRIIFANLRINRKIQYVL